MTQNDFAALNALLPSPQRRTLGELSANDAGVRCLDAQLSCSTLDAIWFDKVKEGWYDQGYFHQVRSADAFYKHGDLYYLIEFKTGKIQNVDLHRKLYDSLIGLIEHQVLTLSECRENLQYIVVSLQCGVFAQHKEMMEHFACGVNEPWDYAVTRQALKTWEKNDIRKLSGFLVNKVFKLSPSDFDIFVRNRNWSN